jgi:hypothetical protein
MPDFAPPERISVYPQLKPQSIWDKRAVVFISKCGGNKNPSSRGIYTRVRSWGLPEKRGILGRNVTTEGIMERRLIAWIIEQLMYAYLPRSALQIRAVDYFAS